MTAFIYLSVDDSFKQNGLMHDSVLYLSEPPISVSFHHHHGWANLQTDVPTNKKKMVVNCMISSYVGTGTL